MIAYDPEIVKAGTGFLFPLKRRFFANGSAPLAANEISSFCPFDKAFFGATRPFWGFSPTEVFRGLFFRLIWPVFRFFCRKIPSVFRNPESFPPHFSQKLENRTVFRRISRRVNFSTLHKNKQIFSTPVQIAQTSFFLHFHTCFSVFCHFFGFFSLLPPFMNLRPPIAIPLRF